MFFLAIITLLTIIFFQDLKGRSVNWILFPALLGCVFVWKSQEISNFLWVNYFLVNVAIITIQLIFIWFYVIIKYGSYGFINVHIGLGDVLFWIVSASFFSVFQWVLFHLLSLLFASIVYMIIAVFSEKKFGSIPLAGLQAFFYLLVMLVSFTVNFSTYNDDHLMKFFY